MIGMVGISVNRFEELMEAETKSKSYKAAFEVMATDFESVSRETILQIYEIIEQGALPDDDISELNE